MFLGCEGFSPACQLRGPAENVSTLMLVARGALHPLVSASLCISLGPHVSVCLRLLVSVCLLGLIVSLLRPPSLSLCLFFSALPFCVSLQLFIWLFVQISGLLAMHPFHPSSLRPSVRPSTHPSTHPPTHSYISFCIQAPAHSSVSVFRSASVSVSMPLSTLESTHAYLFLHLDLSFLLSLCLSASMCISLHTHIHLSLSLSLYLPASRHIARRACVHLICGKQIAPPRQNRLLAKLNGHHF